jgi:predicted ATPase
MISSLRVDGFRSLKNFEFKIKPGLNVLVGANGAGKTTIVRFFEFLTNICEYNLVEALSKSGGAGEVFDRAKEESELKSKYTLSFSVSGSGTTLFRSESFELIYDLSIRIGFDPDKGDIRFEAQKCSFRLTGKGKNSKIITADGNISWDAVNANIEFSSPKIVEQLLGDRATKAQKYFNEQKEYLSGNFLFSTFIPLEPVYFKIIDDLRNGKAFNIVPNSVRTDEDVATTPIVGHDGRGLAATLYSLKRPQRDERFISFFISRRPASAGPATFARIKKLLALINGDIIDVDVTNDFQENKLSIKATLKGDGREFSVPLRYLSDGTVKWLATITAMLTAGTKIIIEEPENYLHPRMLFEVVSLARNLSEESPEFFAIMTTHSETLLNYIDPEEIVFVDYFSGYTQTSRIENVEELRKEINRSGFGVGWLYSSDALQQWRN